MGKKHRRNTAKTGDKALYKQRSLPSSSQKTRNSGNDDDDDDNDAMYSKVDRFYNQQDEEDYIQLTTAGRGDDDEDDEILQQEAVLDLGGGDVSSSNEEEDDDDDSEQEDDSGGVDSTAPALSSTDDDDDDDDMEDDVRNWGTKKSVYYHGDTADLEIGQEQEDAFVEEEAAREVHMARIKELSEEDFVLSDNEGDNNDNVNESNREDNDDDESDDDRASGKEDKKVGNNKMKHLSLFLSAGGSSPSKTLNMSHGASRRRHRDTSNWSIKEQRTFLEQHHPEFLPLVTHFKDVIQDFEQRTNVIVRAFYEQPSPQSNQTTSAIPKEVGATPEGERYLLSRALLQSSAALNLTIYLMLKAEYAAASSSSGANTANGNIMVADDSIMSSHPVLDHLQKLYRWAETMEETVQSDSLNKQMNNLVKASALLENGVIDDDDDDNINEEPNSADYKNLIEDANGSLPRTHEGTNPAAVMIPNEDENDETSESDDSDDQGLIQVKQEAALLNEARFALRFNEVGPKVEQSIGSTSLEQANRTRTRRRRAAPDLGEEENVGGNSVLNTKKRTSRLASTVNALEQRLASSVQKQNRKSHGGTDDQLDVDDDHDPDGDENQIRRGLELMEAELGQLENNKQKRQGHTRDEREDHDGYEVEDDGDDDDEDLKFYNSVAKSRQEQKKQRKDQYAVAPKFPRLDTALGNGEERPISRTILKNRGLVPHKNKLNRNPRVKKREQYRKALIRRKGAIRTVRDPREGQFYGGEETGIKSGLKRSRKLT